MMLSIKEIRKEATHWQRELGLGDWEIQVNWGRPAAVPNFDKGEMEADSVGNVCWHTEESVAWVYLRRGAGNVQETLVHEMLHVRLEGHREAPMRYDPLYERALNAIATALVANDWRT